MHVLHSGMWMRYTLDRYITVGRENGGAHGQPSTETERADSLKSRQATEIGPCVPFSTAISVSQHPVIALCCSIDFVLNPGLVTDTLSYYLQPSVPSPPPFFPSPIPHLSICQWGWRHQPEGNYENKAFQQLISWLLVSVCKGCLYCGWPLRCSWIEDKQETTIDRQ